MRSGRIARGPDLWPWAAMLPFRDRLRAGGRYWVRTSDLFGVNEARYHCANRPGDTGRRHRLAQERARTETGRAVDVPAKLSFG